MRRPLALLVLTCLAVPGAAAAANGSWQTGRYDGRIAGDGVTTRRATSAVLEVTRTTVRAVRLNARFRCDDGSARREAISLRAVRLKRGPLGAGFLFYKAPDPDGGAGLSWYIVGGIKGGTLRANYSAERTIDGPDGSVRCNDDGYLTARAQR
jgi:hypothetical protein